MTQWRNLLTSLTLLVNVVVVLFAWPALVFAQAQVQPDQPPLYLEKEKLVSRGKGWAMTSQRSSSPVDCSNCFDERLYWTNDNGRTWRNITPPRTSTQDLTQIFFLDRSHGWVVLEDYKGDQSSDSLASTRDGGGSWQVFPLLRSAYQMEDGFGPGEVFFSDPRHGWFLWSWPMHFSSQTALLTTKDGGRTWKRLSDPPGEGPMNFLSARDGLMIGGSQLWATHDGGTRWQMVSVPIPKDFQEQNFSFSAVKLKNPHKGMLAAGLSTTSSGTSRFVGCITHDGGKTWQFSQVDDPTADPSFVDMHIVWVYSDSGTNIVKIRNGDKVVSSIVPGFESGNARGSFIDDKNGWFVYSAGLWSPTFGIPGVELLATTDGGKTFRLATFPGGSTNPALPPLQMISVNGLPAHAYEAFYGSPAILIGVSAGSPMQIWGTRFLAENSVWIGSRKLQVASKDGVKLLFLVPPDLPLGINSLYIENAVGDTHVVQLLVGQSDGKARISGVNEREVSSAENPTIHPGQPVKLYGSGFHLDNTVWFGTHASVASLEFSGGAAYLIVDVPASVEPGPCEIYVANAAGKSNIVRAVIE